MCMPIDDLAEIMSVHAKIFDNGGGESVAEKITGDTVFFPMRR